MKVNLVVTTAGPNNGKAIPIAGAKFLIGRDPHCNLRPASQAISKQHCVLLVRDGRVFVQDLSSMNGTLLNGSPVQGEMAVMDGDQLKVGPLEFKVQIIPLPTPADGTPLPDKLKALGGSSSTQKPAPRPSSAQKPVTAPATTAAAAPERIGGGTDADDAAAMLLGMDDDSPSGESPNIPGGSTVMEIPTVDASGRPIPPKKDEKKATAESSTAANDLLKKYFRRTS
ncbi:MAG: FHA domain-containing protein [Gemmataceae bacterium]